MNRKREDIRYLISIDCLEKELNKLLKSDEKTLEVIKRIEELEGNIRGLKRDRELSKRGR